MDMYSYDRELSELLHKQHGIVSVSVYCVITYLVYASDRDRWGDSTQKDQLYAECSEKFIYSEAVFLYCF